MKIIFLLGSESDQEFTSKISSKIEQWGIDFEINVASAHKVPEKVIEIITKNNKSEDQIVYIAVVGRSNGLAGVAAANSIHPVITCPPFKDKEDFMVNINSSLIMPSDTPVMTVVDPGNAAMAAIRILALQDKDLSKKISERIQEIKKSF